MKLLITTQVIDTEDPVLGFFHEWVCELAERMDTVEVICLKLGKHSLPPNVRVHSLGKEQGSRSRAAYMFSYLSLARRLRHDYDAVFVHMNQEYILIAGWLWKLLGKRVYMWRNHYAGSILTDIAAAFCDTIFCTSKHSYTAKYKKTMLMPVGVDTKRFHTDSQTKRLPRSMLFLGRMSPSKRPDMLFKALGILIEKGTSFTASFYGSPAKGDEAYYENLKHQAELFGLHDRVRFYPAVSHEKAATIFQKHDIFVNCSPSGMFDKTLFEAAASGCLVLSASSDFAERAGENAYFDGTAEDLADRLTALLALPEAEANAQREQLAAFAADNGLIPLADTLAGELHANAYRSPLLRRVVWKTLYALQHLFVLRAPRLSILMYHSVSNEPDFFTVTPQRFTAQLDYLVKKNISIGTLDDALAYLNGTRLKRDTVIITSDDGYEDFIAYAIPLLATHCMPSTVFYLSGPVDRVELGNDALLAKRVHAGPFVTAGSHGATHRKLTRLNGDETLRELKDSRDWVGRQSGMPVRFFAYPKGSHNPRVMELVREAGYEAAVTAVARAVRRSDDPFAIPRIQIDASTSMAEFRAKLTPAADWYHALWVLLRRGRRK